MKTVGSVISSSSDKPSGPTYRWELFRTVDLPDSTGPKHMYAWQRIKDPSEKGTREDFGYGYNDSGPEYYFSCDLHIDEPKRAKSIKSARNVLYRYLEYRKRSPHNYPLASFIRAPRYDMRGSTPELDIAGLGHFLLDERTSGCSSGRPRASGLRKVLAHFRAFCAEIHLCAALESLSNNGRRKGKLVVLDTQLQVDLRPLTLPRSALRLAPQVAVVKLV
ncbi:hypothetical protein MBLNU457_7394t1 [Dothideomycetes sp. NU457]